MMSFGLEIRERSPKLRISFWPEVFRVFNVYLYENGTFRRVSSEPNKRVFSMECIIETISSTFIRIDVIPTSRGLHQLQVDRVDPAVGRNHKVGSDNAAGGGHEVGSDYAFRGDHEVGSNNTVEGNHVVRKGRASDSGYAGRDHRVGSANGSMGGMSLDSDVL
jgi:hypothetical protein